MTTLPKPFDVPVSVAGLECFVTIIIETFVPPSSGFFNPINGDGEPPHEGLLEFRVDTIRIEGSPITIGVSVEMSGDLLEHSRELAQACLDAIEEANQPPEDR